MMKDFPILLVDDEIEILKSLKFLCHSEGFQNVTVCSDPTSVLDFIAEKNIRLVLLDLNMPQISGEKLLPEITHNYPDVSTIVVSGYDEVDRVVKCMKNGAVDYLVKPVESLRMKATIQQQYEMFRLKRENSRLSEKLLTPQLDNPDCFRHIITCDSKMYSIFDYIEAVSKSRKPVLITGETGTGKELIARAVHESSGRSGELVSINVAGLDAQSFADSLFGHVKGAFTGADSNRAGAIKEAEHGTLFLDEIGDLEESQQIKLLRVLQENEYTPLGTDKPRSCDVRIVACTNYPTVDLIDSGKMRRDFFYRISPYQIELPSLRERLGDLDLLLDYFFEKVCVDLGRNQISVPPSLKLLLQNYSFPGNIRELEGMVYDSLSNYREGRLSLDSYRRHIEKYSDGNMSVDQIEDVAPDKLIQSVNPLPKLKECSSLLVEEAMRRSHGNKSVAASMLGITRQALHQRLGK